jgi:hypothetical protein
VAEVIADHALGSHERHSELLPGDGRCEPQVELATIRGPQVDARSQRLSGR